MMSPTREEFTELIYYISELKHQYSTKIDEQTIKINDQSCVIEELLWQVRELSDKLRQMSQRVIDMEKMADEFKHKRNEKVYENVVFQKNHLFSRQNSSARIPMKKSMPKTVASVDNKIRQEHLCPDYELFEFSDSSDIYAEPVNEDYGQLRKIRTSVRQHIAIIKKKQQQQDPKSEAKKPTTPSNMKTFKNSEDLTKTDDEPEVELRSKPEQENSLTHVHDQRFIHELQRDDIVSET